MNKAMHTTLLTYKDGRPPCGSRDRVLRSMNLENVSCSNCHGQLLAAMAKGLLQEDFRRWFLEWRGYSVEAPDDALQRYLTFSLNRGIAWPVKGNGSTASPNEKTVPDGIRHHQQEEDSLCAPRTPDLSRLI
jgi:hypothetical protein